MESTDSMNSDNLSLSAYKLWFWALLSICLLQGFNTVNKTLSELVSIWIVNKQVPLTSWWAVVDFRGVGWLLAAPILAGIIVQWQVPIRKLIVWHLLLLSTLIAANRLYVHPLEHRQKTEIRYIVFGEEGLRTTKRMNAKLGPGIAGCQEGFWAWFGECTNGLSTYVMVSGIGYAVFYYKLRELRRRQSSELQSLLDRLQYETLCNRLQPHFLYNTLNMIGALAAKDPEATRLCITQLSTLLRHSTESLPGKEIDLDSEIEILECYLDIQKMRYGDKFTYDIEVDNHVADAFVPAFVLQPLVENCFVHGFRDKQDVGYIGIFATKNDNYCHIEVIDNGITIAPDQAIDERTGIGLTRERLRLQYNEEASIDFVPNSPCGMRVILEIPIVV